MKQEKRNKGMTVTALVVAGLAIVGLAVLTSDPFQRWATSTEVEQDIPPAAATTDKPPEAAEDAPSKATVNTPTDVTSSEAAQATPADASASGAAAAANGECCKVGDTTPPLDLVKKVPPGGLHNPYDWKKLAAEQDDPDYLVKQFRLPGCNECHGGGGGGGMCPALSQGIWFWGNTDDVLFRLISLGTADLEKSGFTRYQYGSVHAPMPPMAVSIKTSDHLWKIIAFIRSINPPGTNPPEKVIPGKYTPPGGANPQ